MDPLIEIKNVHKVYQLGKLQVPALRNINLLLQKGEFTCIAGPSGSGKSTLLNIVGCLDKPSQGTLSFEGKAVANMTDNEQSEFRGKKIGFIFQSFNLIPVLNVFENIEFPILFGNSALPAKSRKEFVLHLIEQVGLQDHIKQRPNELSGGEQQRVAIARALVNRPVLVLADEVTANLDSENSRKVLEIMSKLNADEKTTFIFSTHDAFVMKYAKRILRLHDGEIAEDIHQHD